MTKLKKVSFISPLLIFTLFISVFTPIKAYAATSPSLGDAASYSVLAGSAVTNTGATTISGDVGISPGIGPAPHYTGFGTVTLGGNIHDADANALQAQADRAIAYAALNAQGCDTTYVGVFKELAGENLIPGVYCADQFRLSGTLTLNGDSSDVWIFKSAADLIISGGAAAEIIFTGGGLACNVWWTAVSTATMDANSTFAGTIIADTSITMSAGASLNGRALAGTAAMTMSSNSITGPTCSAPSSGGSSSGSNPRPVVPTPTVFPPSLAYVSPATSITPPNFPTGVTRLPVTGINVEKNTLMPIGFLTLLIAGLYIMYPSRRKKIV